jgi:hypothetical protein
VFFPYNPFNHGLGLDARRLRRANALIEAVERLGGEALQRRTGERFRMEVRPYVKLGCTFWLPLMINTRTGESRMVCWCETAALAEEEVHVLALLRIYSPKDFLRAWRKMDDPDDRCDCWLDPEFVSCEHSRYHAVREKLFDRAWARRRRPGPASLAA